MQTKLNDVIKIVLLAALFTRVAPIANAQRIFAHNDYLKPKPFYTAFDLKADYIEADIFLQNGVLVVAHDSTEIDPSKTLESMYLKPLLKKREELYGVTLMIDLKVQVMDVLVKELEKFPALISHPNFTVAISGNYPPPSEWKKYPAYIWFDGRPNINYTEDQKERLKMISTSFSSVSKWNGNGGIPEPDLTKIREVIDHAHKLNQPVRFWGAPDFENAWDKLEAIGVDVINSDNIEKLAAHLRN